MTHGSIARRYAGVLFGLVGSGAGAERALADLQAVRDLVAGHAELRQVFEMPMVAPAKKRAIIEAIFTGPNAVSAEVTRLLALLADRDRLSALADVTSAFNDLVMKSQNVVSADVVTAVPLTDAGRTALGAALGKAVGSRVVMHERLDPAILGGIIARVGSVVYDGSVSRQIERLRERLATDA